MDGYENSVDDVQSQSSVNEYRKEDVHDVTNDAISKQDGSEAGNDVEPSKDFNVIGQGLEEVEHPFQYSNDTSDLRLIVEGKPLYVSRVVLSLVSPVLKRYGSFILYPIVNKLKCRTMFMKSKVF